MSRGINKAIIVGNVGQDPEVRYTPGGDAVATLSLATNEQWLDKQSGQKQQKTEWHRVVMWRKMAEIAQQHVKKGMTLYVEGKLQTRKWQDQTGIDRYSTEIVARDMQMLGSPGGQQSQSGQNAGNVPPDSGRNANAQRTHNGGNAPAPQSSPYAENPRSGQGSYGAPDPGNFDDFDDEIPFDQAGA